MERKTYREFPKNRKPDFERVEIKKQFNRNNVPRASYARPHPVRTGKY